MPHRYLSLLVLFFLFCYSFPTEARHIIGGDLTMQELNRPGLFRLELNQYWDNLTSNPGNQDVNVVLLVYRKNNPVLIEQITVNRQNTTPLTYGNPSCARLRNLSTSHARYSRDYQFDVSKYTDPGGYYIVWERCCRNNDINNVANSINVGMVFYLEFPPMVRNGATFHNSSPMFSQPNGDYICRNKLFSMDFGATDADGDQLVYRLVTPFQGYTTDMMTNGTTDPKAGYPVVTWAQGVNIDNVIPGSPSLRVNPGTGLLEVRARDIGLYLFTVQVEEYRNGQLIGLIRRDFQLPVVDCSQNTPPPAVILQNTEPVKNVEWCSSDPLILEVEGRPEWAFQWQVDGNNIPGANRPSITVQKSGVYTVVKSFSGQCAGDTVSEATNVTVNTGPKVQLSARMMPVCDGDTVTLRAILANAVSEQGISWLRDGQPITGSAGSSLVVNQPGLYSVLIQGASAECVGRDTLRVRTVSPPVISIQSASANFCEGDSLRLSTAVGTNFRYTWTLDGNRLSTVSNQLFARQTGTYDVQVLTPEGCRVSASKAITRNPKPVVSMTGIPSVCSSTTLTIALQGQPAGGVFSGAGVEAGTFDPAKAGPGNHTIRYIYTNASGCKNDVTQTAEVLPPLSLDLKDDYSIFEGDSVRLITISNKQQTTYQWEPPATLNNPTIASPTAAPRETTIYNLVATSPGGCLTTATVNVRVGKRLFIPDAFTPNGDGINDSWEIRNTDTFEKCEVTVYNRWGEVVFCSQDYQTPWDGSYQGEKLPPGLYTYRIKTSFSQVTYQGRVTLLR